MDGVGTFEDVFCAVLLVAGFGGVGEEGPVVACYVEVCIGTCVAVGEDVVDVVLAGLFGEGEDDQSGGFAVDDLLAGEESRAGGAAVDEGVGAGVAGEGVLGVDDPGAVVDGQRSERAGGGCEGGR